MKQVASLVKRKDASGHILMFQCPGCRNPHGVWVDGAVNDLTGGKWDWNQSLEAPTISPSILVTYNGSDADKAGAHPSRCHSYVRNGMIEFLGDSSHSLAGKTVPLEPEEP